MKKIKRIYTNIMGFLIIMLLPAIVILWISLFTTIPLWLSIVSLSIISIVILDFCVAAIIDLRKYRQITRKEEK